MDMSDNGIGDDGKTHQIDELPEFVGTPRRVTTGPLDEVLPWVLEFRIVGTASTIQLRVSEHMIIGRGDPARGAFPDVDLGVHGGHVKGVSREHAHIVASDDSITIKDNGSANGTRLNGHMLTPREPYRLRHGDEVTFGQLAVQVLFAVVPLMKDDSKLEDTAIPNVGGGLNALVIEDDTDVASVFGMILEQAGFKVNVVHTGAAAIGHMSMALPDAVVLDLMLPDMDGLDLAKYIRKEEGTDKHVSLVVASGVTGGFQKNRALEAGADLFLGKPVGVDELVDAFVQLMPQQTD